MKKKLTTKHAKKNDSICLIVFHFHAIRWYISTWNGWQMMRSAVFLMLCSASFVAGLYRLNESDHHRHKSDTATVSLPNSSVPPSSVDDAGSLRLTSFFKLAHSRITPESDLRAVAKALAPLYVQLCAEVSDCDEGVMELLTDHQNELRLAADRMDRLHLVLNRVRRLVHSDDGRKHAQHRGLWRRPLHRGKEGGVFKHMEV